MNRNTVKDWLTGVIHSRTHAAYMDKGTCKLAETEAGSSVYCLVTLRYCSAFRTTWDNAVGGGHDPSWQFCIRNRCILPSRIRLSIWSSKSCDFWLPGREKKPYRWVANEHEPREYNWWDIQMEEELVWSCSRKTQNELLKDRDLKAIHPSNRIRSSDSLVVRPPKAICSCPRS